MWQLSVELPQHLYVCKCYVEVSRPSTCANASAMHACQVQLQGITHPCCLFAVGQGCVRAPSLLRPAPRHICQPSPGDGPTAGMLWGPLRTIWQHCQHHRSILIIFGTQSAVKVRGGLQD
jgi:hypothetical protein